MEYVGYSTPESAAKELMDEEITSNPIYYPPQEIIDNSEVFLSLPSDINEKIDKLWVEVKMGSSGSTYTLIAVLAGFLLLYIVIVITKTMKRRRMNRY